MISILDRSGSDGSNTDKEQAMGEIRPRGGCWKLAAFLCKSVVQRSKMLW